MVDKFVSSKNVLNKLYRDLGLNTEINEAHVIEWIAEVLEKIGTYSQYKQMKECLEVVNGIAKLPTNFYKISDLRFNNEQLSWANNDSYSEYACSACTIKKCCARYTFYISGGNIITNLKETDINREGDSALCISYLGVPIDSEGYPLVPDDVYFLEACSKYVTYMLDYREWRKGNLADKVINKSETDYLWAVGAAKGSGNTPNAAKLENIKNVWVRLIPRQNGMDNNPEKIIRH